MSFRHRGKPAGILKNGDIVSYDKIAKAMIFTRGAEPLFRDFDDDDKWLPRMITCSNVIFIVDMLSAASGLSYRRISNGAYQFFQE